MYKIFSWIFSNNKQLNLNMVKFGTDTTIFKKNKELLVVYTNCITDEILDLLHPSVRNIRFESCREYNNELTFNVSLSKWNKFRYNLIHLEINGVLMDEHGMFIDDQFFKNYLINKNGEMPLLKFINIGPLQKILDDNEREQRRKCLQRTFTGY